MYINEKFLRDNKVNVMDIATKLGMFMSTTAEMHKKDSEAWDDLFEKLEWASSSLMKHPEDRNTGIMLEAMTFAMDSLLETYQFKDKSWYELVKNIKYLKDGIRDGRVAKEFAIVYEAAGAINKRLEEQEKDREKEKIIAQ